MSNQRITTSASANTDATSGDAPSKRERKSFAVGSAASYAPHIDAPLGVAKGAPVPKVLAAVVFAAFGFVLVITTLNFLAPQTHKREKEEGTRKIAMPAVVKPPPPPPQKKRRPKRAKKARQAKAAQAAAPRIGNALGALNFGLPSAFDVGAGFDVDQSLLGETKNVVMTEDTVDELPRPLSRPAPQMPARARREGVEGRVVLRLSIDVSGRVTRAVVIESTHPELFDAVAVAAAKRWRYAPARYHGKPVAISANQPVEFKLEAAK